MSYCLKLLTTRLFVWQLVQANNKKHQSLSLLALCPWGFPVTSDSSHKGPVMRKAFTCHWRHLYHLGYLTVLVWNLSFHVNHLHYFLKVQFTVNQLWFMQKLCTKLMTGLNLNQLWSSLLTYICVSGLSELTKWSPTIAIHYTMH